MEGIWYYQPFDSPVGRLYLLAKEEHLHAIAFESNWPRIRAALTLRQEQDTPVLQMTREQLKEYFAGDRHTFELPLQLQGTPFQQQTWQALMAIPYGETRTYSEQAKALGKPLAVRAVGHANSLNPLSIIVPCHRVVAKSGYLTGYAGGLHAKRFLLELEGVQTPLL